MAPPKIAVFGVPSAAGARGPGMERAAFALREAGLLPALDDFLHESTEEVQGAQVAGRGSREMGIQALDQSAQAPPFQVRDQWRIFGGAHRDTSGSATSAYSVKGRTTTGSATIR